MTDKQERQEYALTPGEWTDVPDALYGTARAMPGSDPANRGTRCWVEPESKLVDADGPVTVDYGPFNER